MDGRGDNNTYGSDTKAVMNPMSVRCLLCMESAWAICTRMCVFALTLYLHNVMLGIVRFRVKSGTQFLPVCSRCQNSPTKGTSTASPHSPYTSLLLRGQYSSGNSPLGGETRGTILKR